MSGGGRGAALVSMLVLVGCTEPNPYLPVTGSSTTEVAASSSTVAVPMGTTTGPDGSSSSSSSSGNDGDGSSSGSAPSCDAMGMACVDSAPAGWLGPFAWRQQPSDETPAGCEAPWEVPLVEASSVISAPAARCGCECGPFGGGTCGSGTVTRYAQAGCNGGFTHITSVDPGCNELPGMDWPAGGSYLFEPPSIQGGGCLPMGELYKQDATFLERHLACGGRWTAQGCEAGRLCVPPPADPFHPRLCIAWEDDVECPPGSDYAERTLLYRGLDDERGCDPCTCTPPGSCVGGFGDLSSTVGCSGAGAQLPPGMCTAGGATSVASIDYVPSAPLGSCEPAIVLPTGLAVGTMPVTFCCTR